MALTYTEANNLGMKAPGFALQGVDGKEYTLESFKDKKALCVIFMCNHCPYVVAVQDRINDLAKEFGQESFALVGINPNDTVKYPEDNFEAMKVRAKEQGYVFPYLLDETQKVAREYGAVCTPDPYLYENVDGQFVLRYHGRIDDNWKEPTNVQSRDLAHAIQAVLKGEPVSQDQKPAMGCSIKWK